MSIFRGAPSFPIDSRYFEGGRRIYSRLSDGLTAILNGIVTGSISLGQTVAQPFTNGIKTNTVDERTAGTGVTVDGLRVKDGALNLLAVDDATEVTISAGVLVVTQAYHKVDTEADAASDDVDTITGVGAGEFLILRLENAARNVALKHGTGNIQNPQGVDLTMDGANDRVVLLGDGVNLVIVVAPLTTAEDLGAQGLKTDLVEESTLNAGVTIDGLRVKDGALKVLNVDAFAEITIAAGVATVTQAYHTVDTEADAASDDVDTLSGLADGKFAILTPADGARTVVLKHGTGNLVCPGGFDVTLDAITDLALCFQSGGSVIVLATSLAVLANGGLGRALASAANGQGASRIAVEDIGAFFAGLDVEAVLQEIGTDLAALPLASLALLAATELTLAAGAITITQPLHTVDTEADAASDDLDTITGGVAGNILVLFPSNDARTVVVKHGTGNILCPAGEDITLAEDDDYAMLVRGAVNWTVIAFKTLAAAGGGLGVALGSTSSGKGTALIGSEDLGTFFTGATAEAQLQELGAVRSYRQYLEIANADLKTLNATPIQVIAAPGAGKFIEVVSLHAWLDFAGAGFDAVAAGDDLVLKYTDAAGAAVTPIIAGAGFGDAVADAHRFVQGLGTDLTPVENAAVVAHILVGEWFGAAGGSALKLEVIYRIRTLEPAA